MGCKSDKDHLFSHIFRCLMVFHQNLVFDILFYLRFGYIQTYLFLKIDLYLLHTNSELFNICMMKLFN